MRRQPRQIRDRERSLIAEHPQRAVYRGALPRASIAVQAIELARGEKLACSHWKYNAFHKSLARGEVTAG
jgi:hypothetical protein